LCRVLTLGRMRWSGYAEPILMRLNGPFPDIRILTCFEPSKSVFKAWSNPTATATLTLGHENAIADLALSADGQRLVPASADRAVNIWNPRTGKLIASFVGESEITCSAQSIHKLTFFAGERSSNPFSEAGRSRSFLNSQQAAAPGNTE
jgi:WD40 repeat protein